MSEGSIKSKSLQLSVVMPAYNGAEWLEPTTQKILDAMKAARVDDFEIIIVDDGSSDATKIVAEELYRQNDTHFTVLSHPNRGRYLTRKRGVESARYDRILFIDTRVWIDEGAIDFLTRQFTRYPDRIIWNGHINVAKKGNIIARFGDAITILGWRRYFKHPRLTSYSLEDFDHYPKGTGLFTVPKVLITEAFEWFEENTTDIKNSSDDTLLIRHLAESNPIWLSPEFSGTYFARTTLRAFLRHTYYRGRFFVDGFLRKGTRFYYPIIMFLVSTVLFIVVCITAPTVAKAVLLLAGVFWLGLLPLGLLFGLGVKDAISLLILSPPFIFAYGAGIWTAVIKRAIKGVK